MMVSFEQLAIVVGEPPHVPKPAPGPLLLGMQESLRLLDACRSVCVVSSEATEAP